MQQVLALYAQLFLITRNSGKCLKRACLSLVILQGSGHPGRVDYDQSPYKAMFN